MKCYLIIILCCSISGCTDNTPQAPIDRGILRLSLATQGIYDFATYIQSLSIYAFKENSQGEYVFFKQLADFDANDLEQLEHGVSPEENLTDSRLLTIDIPVGKYQLYFIANTQAIADSPLSEGVTTPSDIYLRYPATGLYRSFFLSKTPFEAGTSATTLPIVLQRTVSQIFLKISNIPQQIDKIQLTVDNIAGQIDLDETYSGSPVTIEQIFQMKNTDIYIQDTALFEMFTFPTLKDHSTLKIIFYSRSGEQRTKTIDILLTPDKYLYLNAEVNNAIGSLLSFDVTFIYFFSWDWANITLPDFPINPL